jgi:GT2 family glycosyltransferase
MHTQPLISIVIVTRNRKAELKKCLQAVALQKYTNIETLVIDNKSVDGTVEMLLTEFPAVNLIRMDRNLGCPGARNVGVLNARGEILFFLDDDCIMDVDAINNALPYFIADDHLAVVTPQIIEPESGGMLFITGDSVRYSHDFTGVSAIRRSVFDNFGLYPINFLYGAEETDLSVRILNGDGHILYVPQVKVYHYPAKNRDRNWEMEQKLLNSIQVLLKYAPMGRLLGGILVKPLSFLPQAVHYQSTWGWFKAILRIPLLTVKFLASGQRTPLGWKPFLLGEFLMSHSITSLENLARVDEKQLTPLVFKSRLSRLFPSKHFRE